LRQQADESFDVRLHFARAAQAEFFPRTALPELAHLLVTRIRVFIELKDGSGFSQSEHLAAENLRPTDNGSESGFWTSFLGEEWEGVQESTVATLCNRLRQIAAVFERHGNLRQVATFCDNLTARIDVKGQQRPGSGT
jgi:hypothetical protein